MNQLRPCTYCGCTSFHYLPEVALEAGTMTTVLGMRARSHVANQWWIFKLVVCTNCGNSMIFTTNAPEMAQHVAGATVIHAGG